MAQDVGTTQPFDPEHARTYSEARKMLKTARAVYVAIMCGNACWSVQTTKDQARRMLRALEDDYPTVEELDVSSLGFMGSDGILHLGGC